MKHLLLALSTLSLCACSIAMETTEPVIESIVLTEEYSKDGINCTAEGEYPRISELASRQVEININSYFDRATHQIQEHIRNCDEQYEALIEEGTELSEKTNVDFQVTLINEQYLSILLLQSTY